MNTRMDYIYARQSVDRKDRISRSILDFANMMELFQQYDVEFVSSTEKFDTSTPMGRAMLNICIVFAQLERETIQKRVTDAYYSRCTKGFHMSGAAPYGYRLEPTVVDGIRTKMMVADPETADLADFAGTNGCYLYQGRDVKEDKDKSLKDQILVVAPHEPIVSSEIWLRCRKKLMNNITFQNGRKAQNTWLAGKIKCGNCGYALNVARGGACYEYLRCTKRADNKGCAGCGTIRKSEFEQFIFTAMCEKLREFKLLRGGEEKANPKLTALQVELAQVETEIEKLLDTLTGANATLLAYANSKIEDLDKRRQTLTNAVAELSVETISPKQIELLSGHLDNWENVSFDDKRKVLDGLISQIRATNDFVQIEWKI